MDPRQELEVLTQHYLRFLQMTLLEIFQVPREDAEALQTRFMHGRRFLDAYTLHREPLEIAIDLLGRQPSRSEEASYFKLVETQGWFISDMP